MIINITRAFLGILFFYIIIFTNYGLVDYFHFVKSIKKIQKEIDYLNKDKVILLKKVEDFSGPVIEFDLLETQARSIMGVVQEDEKIYFWRETQEG